MLHDLFISNMYISIYFQVVTISGPGTEAVIFSLKGTQQEVLWLVLRFYALTVGSHTNSIHHYGVIETMNVEKRLPSTAHFVPIVQNKRVTWKNMLKESTIKMQIQK